jgi:hypothetical protein
MPTFHEMRIEVAHEVLAEAQGAILPLVPYLDTLRWIFIALALAVSATPTTSCHC